MKALFDLSFTQFIAPSIARIVYLLILAAVAVAYLVFVVAAFQVDVGFGVIAMLIIGPLFALVYIVLARVGLESLIASIRTAQNTAELVRLSGGHAQSGGPMHPRNQYGNSTYRQNPPPGQPEWPQEPPPRSAPPG